MISFDSSAVLSSANVTLYMDSVMPAAAATAADDDDDDDDDEQSASCEIYNM
jgi:hypothetical protein